jgi:hypothetical protein
MPRVKARPGCRVVRAYVTMQVPKDCDYNDAQLAGYIIEAVSQWNGQFEPPNDYNGYQGDTLFGAFREDNDVTVQIGGTLYVDKPPEPSIQVVDNEGKDPPMNVKITGLP